LSLFVIVVITVQRHLINVSVVDDDFGEAAQRATKLPQLAQVRRQDRDI
jgi:hypothetical protein